MAQIQEKVKNGKIVSFKIRVFLGRNGTGKQVFLCKIWKPPAGMTNTKSRKEAEWVAVLWEMELTAPPAPEPKREKEEKSVADVKEPEPKAPSMTFGEIAEDMWLSFCVRDGSHCPARTAMAYGCKQVDEFTDEVNEITKVIAISRDEWTAR